MIVTDGSPRITKVRFAGLRTAASVELELGGLTVLIGPNGVGKSTLIEGLELLRKVMSGDDFLRALYSDHGGPMSLRAHGASEIGLGIDVEADGFEYRYALVLGGVNGALEITAESLTQDGETVFVRSRDTLSTTRANSAGNLARLRAPQAVLPLFTDPEIDAVGTLIDSIDVHTPFATQARWAGRDQNARSDNIVQATTRLARGGINLANALHALRNRNDWKDTLETIRVVVDEDIIDVTTPASLSGGTIGFAVTYRTGNVPAFALSDGTLALLSLVVISALDDGAIPRSALVLDEPDLHLHPSAIRYVVALLERCAKRYPVIVATHSDQLLDCLSVPARSTVLCDLDEHRHLRLRRPDAAQLEKWLPEYRGVGHIRAEGYDSLVFPRPVPVVTKS